MDKKGKNRQEGKSAIELAILNGIEAYNREQAKQQAKKAAPVPSAPVHTGETRTKEAMEEAGLKPRRKSRAKGKGTPVLEGSALPAGGQQKRPQPQPRQTAATKDGKRKASSKAFPPLLRRRPRYVPPKSAKNSPSRCSFSAA